nr:immunoglobulin light chain junction region [Mus musculus]
CQQGSSIPRTF